MGFPMFDVGTVLISLSGILFAAIYLILISCVSTVCKEIKDELTKKLQKLDFREHPHRREILLNDYQITNKEIERRENITLIIGSIMLTASFLILGRAIISQAIESRTMAAFASIVLYLFWLFILHLTTKKLDGMAYARIRAIEEKLDQEVNYGFGIHSFFYGILEEKTWILLRRGFWGFTLIILSICWLLFGLFE